MISLTDGLDLLAVQGALKSHLQHHNLKASILWHSALFMVQLTHQYMTVGKAIALTIEIFVGKGFSIINEAQVDVFMELPGFLHDPMNVGNLISGSSASLKHSLYIWKLLVHLLLKTSLQDFEYYLASL